MRMAKDIGRSTVLKKRKIGRDAPSGNGTARRKKKRLNPALNISAFQPSEETKAMSFGAELARGIVNHFFGFGANEETIRAVERAKVVAELMKPNLG